MRKICALLDHPLEYLFLCVVIPNLKGRLCRFSDPRLAILKRIAGV